MKTIKVTTQFAAPAIHRQTLGARGEWGDCKFIINSPTESCDYWIVYEGLNQKETTRCPRSNVIFFSGEPPELRIYDARFLTQFAKAVTCIRSTNLTHRFKVYHQQCLFWQLGETTEVAGKPLIYDDFLKPETFGQKTKLLSLVCSDLQYTEGHRRRFAFVQFLKSHFKDRLHTFGRGTNPIVDKSEAIGDYRYHIAMENSRHPDYWTEKLADAYLGGCFPIYYGCPNVADYFPKESYQEIDIERPQEAVASIEKAIEENLFEKRAAFLQEARRRLLDEHNFFAYLARTCAATSEPKEEVTLYPATALRFALYALPKRILTYPQRLMRRLRNQGM